ncbi:endolysin [Shewanella phage ZP9]|nr:endolysin [Shewanella phage ZP9]
MGNERQGAVMSLIEQLKRHEGLRLKPYKCTAGKLSLGYGRNLEDKGISEREAELMLSSDIHEVQDELSKRLPVYSKLNPARKDALVNMGFNLGVAGLLKFKKMISALELGNYNLAAAEMLDSRWASQVGQRSKELAEQIRTGSY